MSLGLAAVGLLLVVVVPLDSAYWQDLVTLMAIYAIVNMAWSLLLGFGGIFAFGQMAFFAVGGYGSAILGVHTGVSPWPSVLCGCLLAALAGAVLGGVSLRLHGPYIVLFTLAFQLSLLVLISTDTSTLTGGAGGLSGIQPLSDTSDYTRFTYIVSVVFCIATMAFLWALSRSSLGLAMRAIRDSREAAESAGMSEIAHRVLIFVVSSALTGLAGGLLVHWLGVATPSALELGLLINLLAMVVLGGISSLIAGPVAGTVLLVYIDSRLAGQGEYRGLIWGGTIVLALLVLPDGLAGIGNRIAAWLQVGLGKLLADDDPDRDEATPPAGEPSPSA